MATLKTQNRLFKTMTKLTNRFYFGDKSDGTIKQTKLSLFHISQMWKKPFRIALEINKKAMGLDLSTDFLRTSSKCWPKVG